MEKVIPRSWKEEFALAAELRLEEIRQREKIARFEAMERERTAQVRIEQKRREEQAVAMFEAAFASPAAVTEFRVQLDRYDTATVEALMDNGEALPLIRERINGMLRQAHTLPDGRRVFKTLDGQRVFDEHGQELSLETVDPNRIADEKPRWETYKGAKDEGDRLTAEREQLLDYQTRLDKARERLDKGELTQKEFVQLKGDLSAAMPEAVRRKLDASEPPSPAVESNPARMPDNMDALLRQSGLGPAAPAPG